MLAEVYMTLSQPLLLFAKELHILNYQLSAIPFQYDVSSFFGETLILKLHKQ